MWQACPTTPDKRPAQMSAGATQVNGCLVYEVLASLPSKRLHFVDVCSPNQQFRGCKSLVCSCLELVTKVRLMRMGCGSSPRKWQLRKPIPPTRRIRRTRRRSEPLISGVAILEICAFPLTAQVEHSAVEGVRATKEDGDRVWST